MAREAAQTRDTDLDRAMAALSTNNVGDAIRVAQSVCARSDASAGAFEVLSVALYRAQRYSDAVVAARRAVALSPGSADLKTNLGVFLRACGDTSGAEAAYRDAIATDPKLAAAHHNLGNLLRDERGAFRDAELAHLAAVGLAPNYADAWYGLGLDLQKQGRDDAAIPALESATLLAPANAEALVTLGICHFARDHIAEAHDSFQRALAIAPNHAGAHGNLGALYLRGGRILDAEAATRRAMEAAPQEHRWISNLAGVMKDLGRFDEAEALYRRALAMKPDYTIAHSNLLFCLNYHPTRSAEDIFAEYKRWDDVHAKPLLPAKVAHANAPDPARRLRIAFLSPDFREHSARHFLEPLIANLDRDRLEVFAYAQVPVPDAVTEHFKSICDHWRSTVGLSDDAVARAIREDAIDILVDCGGHTASSRLMVLARKPAPLQVAYLVGHGYTSGLSAIDAFLGDHRLVPQGAERLFSETVVRLDRIPVAYRAPDALPEPGPLPARRNGFITFGHFGRPERINDRVVEAWARILAAVPGSRLKLNSKPFLEGQFRDLMHARFARHGIAADRVEMVFTTPQPTTWAAYGDIDIALDPFPHNAGTTSIEALWLGVPVLSINDRASVGRMGAMILGAAGLDQWVADSVDDYVAKAQRFAADIAGLERLRAGLRQLMLASPIADGPGLAKDVQLALRHMWTQWCERQRTGGARIEEAVGAYQSGDFGGCVTVCNRILAVEPQDATALHVRGLARQKLGLREGARDDLEGSIRLEPARADWRWNATAALRASGFLADAERHGREAVRLAPKASEARNNLGSVLRDMGRVGEAEAMFLAAVTLKPDYADAWSNLAWTRSVAGKARQAEEAARHAITIAPDSASALNNLGTSLLQQDRMSEAGDAFERAVALKPDFHVAHSNALFCVNYRHDLTASQIADRYRAWNAGQAARLAPREPVAVRDPVPERRLRVGYVSADFRHHAVSFFMEPLLCAHDKTAIELHLFSDVIAPDGVTARYRALADGWHDIVGMGDDAVAELVRSTGIDVLVDLAGHTSGNRLLVFARKPAPVQFAHMVGSGTTSGLGTFDGFLTCDLLAPVGAEAQFSEPLVRLPHIPVVYQPPTGMPEPGPLPASRAGHVTFGCFSRTARLNDRVLDSWCDLLRRVPSARLLLNSKPYQEIETRQHWLTRFAQRGVATDRVDLVYTTPQPETWKAYTRVDIALDPFPHNAGTTTIEALYMGVPVVSVVDRPPVGRFGAAILGAIGLDDWVTAAPDDYVRRAVRAAEDIDGLALLRRNLRDRFNMSPLRDASGLARLIENAYRRAWSNACSRFVTAAH